MPDLRARLDSRWTPLLVAAPALAAALLQVGAFWPLTHELLALAALLSLGGLAWRRLARAPLPGWGQLGLGVAVAQGLALTTMVGGRWGTLHPGLAPPGRALSTLGALVAGAALVGLARAARREEPASAHPAPEPADTAPLAFLLALPVALAGVARLGASWPWVVELLGLLALGSLAVLAWRRLRAGPPRSLLAPLLALVGGEALALSVLTGGHGAHLHPNLVEPARRLAQVSAIAALLALGALAALPRLRAAWGDGLRGVEAPPLVPPWRPARRAMVLLWALVHVPVCASVPPFLQYDSWTNVLEPDLWVPIELVCHHTPIYSEMVKAANQCPSLLAGLTLLVAFQHVLVLGVAWLAERVVRRATGDAVVAGLVGVALAIDGTLALYAQLVMTETVCLTLLLAAVACLARAESAPREATWVLAAGACTALVTLTRQVFQAWFVVGLVWLLWPGQLRPRGRALAAYGLVALLPVAGMIGHNYVFQGHAGLTAGAGRTFIPRLTIGMPDLTDPQAPPGDERERARQLIWGLRGGGWFEVHQALKGELGWSTERIGVEVHRFYREQVSRYPLLFAQVTLRGMWGMLSHADRFPGIMEFHDKVRPKALAGWEILPDAGTPPRFTAWIDELGFTHRWPVLLLAALSPLLTRGPARRLSLLLLATTAYVVFVPAVCEDPLARYRLPATPHLAIAAGLSLAGLRGLLRRGSAP